MPDDSHVLKYFSFLKSYLSVGPPVYFVINNTNFQLDFANQTIQNRICGGQGCNPDSLQSQIKLWSQEPNITYIGSPAQSWIDDYFGWSKDCCRSFRANGEFCPSDYIENIESEYGSYGSYGSSTDYANYGDYGDYGSVEDSNTQTGCEYCPTRDKSRLNMSTDQFRNQLPWFLKDVPGTACPKAGKAAYSDAVRTSSNLSVIANNFFAFHTVLKTSEDYYEAMRWARRLADNITETINKNITGILFKS